MNGLDLATVRDFGTALLIGALVGTEREKRTSAEAEAGIGGLRTFILLALLGAISGWLANALHMPALPVAMLAIVGAAVLAGYVLAARVHPNSLGITTESAALAVCLLGAMTTLGYRELAVALSIVTAAVLAYKQPLHGLVAKIDWDDIFAGLRLLIATFIVLPLLPSRAVDPWGALNPYSLWLLVLFRRGAGGDSTAVKAEAVPLRNPFSLTEASKFAAFFALVLLVVKLVQIRFPGKGLYMVAALAGMTDVDAITLSMAEYARSGDAHVAVNAIVLATLTNTLVKCGIVATLGGGVLRRAVLIATGAIVATAIVAMAYL